jgi:integrase
MKPHNLDPLYADKYEPLALRSRRPNTRRLYRSTLKFFDEFLGRPATLTDLNDDTVSAFAGWRLSRGLAKRSVNKDLFNLLAVWRWLHKKGYVANWPDVALECPPERTPVALMEDEISRVVQSIAAEREKVGNINGPLFWLALMLVIWDTGERIGAVMELTWDRVDLTRGWVRFDAEDRKGGRADNTLPIAADTIVALKNIRRHGEGLAFPWPYSPTYIYRRLAKIMLRGRTTPVGSMQPLKAQLANVSPTAF